MKNLKVYEYEVITTYIFSAVNTVYSENPWFLRAAVVSHTVYHITQELRFYVGREVSFYEIDY